MNRSLFIVVLWSGVVFFAAPSYGQPKQQQLRMLLPDLLRGGQFEITELSPTVYLDEVGGDTRARIERVEQFLKNEQWHEAIDMLMRLTEESNQLVACKARDASFPLFVTMQHYVNQRLASLPSAAGEALQIYRERVDPLAQSWFDRSVEQRDPALLRRIVKERFNSTVGDEALLRLGDAALEAGQFDRARSNWQAIHAGLNWSSHARKMPFHQRLLHGETLAMVRQDIMATGKSPHVYPESDVPLADVWARMTLASILEQNITRSHYELDVLRRVWPNANGLLAGKDVNYVQGLGKLALESHHWPRRSPVRNWETFAGNNQRNWNLSCPEIDISSPIWTSRLTLAPSGEEQLASNYNLPHAKAGESFDRPCSHFPVVVDDLVLIQDVGRLRCLDLNTGKPAWTGVNSGAFFSSGAGRENVHVIMDGQQLSSIPRLGQRRFTLSGFGETLVATVGGQNARNTKLLGFDLTMEGAFRFAEVDADDFEPHGGTWSFQGAPLCDENFCWVGLRNRTATAQEFVACYDMNTGQQKWRSRICSGETIGHGTTEELSHQLLTLHEGTLYYSTNLGAIASLSAADGAIEWITKYPRKGPTRENLLDEPWYAQRDLTPCLYHDGLLFAAPSDCEFVFALDASTGTMVWQSDIAKDATQILGVGEGDQLVLSGRRLWWLDAYTGELSRNVAANPYPSGEFAHLRGHGRGLLANGNIYWPTETEDASEIHVLSQRTGVRQRQAIDLLEAKARAGNLIVAGDHLLIAAPEELFVFRLGNMLSTSETE